MSLNTEGIIIIIRTGCRRTEVDGHALRNAKRRIYVGRSHAPTSWITEVASFPGHFIPASLHLSAYSSVQRVREKSHNFSEDA